MSGFITMQREALDHPLLQDGDRFRAWFWLIANACWKPTRIKIKGAVIELQRGDLSFSQRFLAEKWGWSKSRVDRFIADLRDHGMIETRSKIGATAGHAAGQGQSILSICNYSKYQDVKDGERGNDETPSGATAGQQRGNSGAKKNKGTIKPYSQSPSGDCAQDPANDEKPDVAPAPADPTKFVYDFAIEDLTKAGRSDKQARAIISKWRQQFTDGAIIDAIIRCRNQRHTPPDPIAFISQELHHGRTRNDQPSRQHHDDLPSDPLARAAVERQASRAAGLG